MKSPRLQSRAEQSTQRTGKTSVEGGCACGAVRYRLTLLPLFVHCCHCTRCQRESGTAFVTHAMIERQCLTWSGEVKASRLPTDSKTRHEIVHCAKCLTPLWGQHGRQPSVIVYLKVCTLDVPEQFPPQAHIFVRSKLSWVSLDAEIPQFAGYYNAAKTWPQASVTRYRSAQC
jgi:hypothetical protein